MSTDNNSNIQKEKGLREKVKKKLSLKFILLVIGGMFLFTLLIPNLWKRLSIPVEETNIEIKNEDFDNEVSVIEENSSMTESKEDILPYDFEGSDTYVPRPEDEYYVGLVDSIRDDLFYTVEKEEYVYSDEDKAVSFYVEYPVVEGENLAFVEQINTELEGSAMFYAREYASEDVTDVSLYIESYVTYMDETVLSVVVDVQCYWGYEGTVELYCLNFDMKTGMAMQNTEMIEVSEELAKEFRKMSDYQNGSIKHLEGLSDSEIAQCLGDDDYLILFYTPVGLEVGINYFDGWVTATIKEYEKYLRVL